MIVLVAMPASCIVMVSRKEADDNEWNNGWRRQEWESKV